MKKLYLFALLTALCIGTGCKPGKTTAPDNLRPLRGANQVASCGETFPERLVIVATGNGKPAEGVKLLFRCDPGSDLKISPDHAVTDAGGAAGVTVTSGHRTGDQFLTVYPEKHPEKSLRVRFASGISVTGSQSEGVTGEWLEQPVTVKVEDANRNALGGVPVSFALTASVEGVNSTCKIRKKSDVTDSKGEAAADIRLGKRTGVYRMTVNVDDPARNIRVRDLNVDLLGVNPSGIIVSVLGGLAIFIYGMGRMSTGLKQVAGENMRRILHFFTGNRVTALLAGAAATAVLQSSSATSVMAVGFINAGLLSLRQALGIIFGASIGTTVTAQIISFNLNALTLPAIILGVVMTLSEKRTLKGWGQTVLGFGLLFFGLSMMSSEIKALGEMPTLRHAFSWFDCAPKTAGGTMPLGAVIGSLMIGMIITVIIQASGAFAGIVLALASGGLVNFYTAVPLLLGANIGTTVTAILASLPGNRVAKQAAVTHTAFKIFGALLMILLFYLPVTSDRTPLLYALTDAITPGNPYGDLPQNLERHIAMAYTICNVFCAVSMLPFLGFYEKLANWLLPIRDEKESQTTVLEPVLLATPSVALKLAATAIRMMTRDACDMVDAALNQHFIAYNNDPEKISRLNEMEKNVDRMQHEVTGYLVKLTRQRLTMPQSELVPLLMHCTNDAERIGDYCEAIITLTQRMIQEKNRLSEAAVMELQSLWQVLSAQAQDVIASLDDNDDERARQAIKAAYAVETLCERFENMHISRLREDGCTASTGVIYVELLGELVKVSSRLSNIAERSIKIHQQYVKL